MSQIIPLFKRMAVKEPSDNIGEGRLEKFFIFTISEKVFAIPAVDISEVAAYSSLIEIPHNSEIISGVVNVRGNIIPIVNLRKRLDLLSDYQITGKTKIIYFKAKQDFVIGMVVDDIDFRLTEGIILPKSNTNQTSNDKGIAEVVMEEKNTESHFSVFFIDNYIKQSEFSDLQKVLESF